jgi:hypothetical protein
VPSAIDLLFSLGRVLKLATPAPAVDHMQVWTALWTARPFETPHSATQLFQLVKNFLQLL